MASAEHREEDPLDRDPSTEQLEDAARFAAALTAVAESVGHGPRKARRLCREELGKRFGIDFLGRIGLSVGARPWSSRGEDEWRDVDAFARALLRGEIIGSSPALLSTDAKRAFHRWCESQSVAPTPYRFIPARLAQAHGFRRMRTRYAAAGKVCGPHEVLTLPAFGLGADRGQIDRALAQAHLAVERFVSAQPSGGGASTRVARAKRSCPETGTTKDRGEGLPRRGAGAT